MYVAWAIEQPAIFIGRLMCLDRSLTLPVCACCLCFIHVGLDPSKDKTSLEDIYDQVYSEFIQEVDADCSGNPAVYGSLETS